MSYLSVTHVALFFFFFNDTATTEIYTLSLHDALPISGRRAAPRGRAARSPRGPRRSWSAPPRAPPSPPRRRSEEHTSELQSRSDLVCRLLLEKKKKAKVQSQYARDVECVEDHPLRLDY